MRFTKPLFTLLVLGLLWAAPRASAAAEAEDAAIAAVRKSADQLAKSFNAAKPDEVAANFLPQGELIDEAGTVYAGRDEIKKLLGAFFQKFPGAKLALSVEGVRLLGPVAVEEGTRTMTTADGALKSRFRYIAVWAKSDKGWQLASIRDFADDPQPAPSEYLQPLAWLVGDWLNEGTDAKVAISYRWSDDKNYLLGDFELKSPDGATMKSSQRIGWDASLGRIRSWLFDADGGFAEGIWTPVDDGVLIKNGSVNPDGTTATATLTMERQDDDHYVIRGTDRIVGDVREPDFEVTVARKPPQASK